MKKNKKEKNRLLQIILTNQVIIYALIVNWLWYEYSFEIEMLFFALKNDLISILEKFAN